MKKTLCSLLVASFLVSTGSSATFAINSKSYCSDNQISSSVVDYNLTELLVKGKGNYEFLGDNNNIILSQFTVDGQKYQIEETIDETVSTVFSNYYKISNDKKEYIGQTQTIISNITNDVSVVKILENGNVIDSQLINFSGSNTYYNPNHDDIVDTVMPMASVEYKWHYLYTSNGSTKIIKYTIGAIIEVLAYAAGGAAAAGLSYIAQAIIDDKIPDVWWTQDVYAYNQRCPDWPSYPDWIPAGKYRYRTKYYSNSSKTKYISSSDYING